MNSEETNVRTFTPPSVSVINAAGLFGAIPLILTPLGAVFATPQTDAITIRTGTRTIGVNRRAARVYGLTQTGGTHDLITDAGRRLRVRLENWLDEETLIRWHGPTPPWQQDGVPGFSQAPLAPGANFDYDFPPELPGTNWMHSHHGLTKPQLLVAPLIVRDRAILPMPLSLCGQLSFHADRQRQTCPRNKQHAASEYCSRSRHEVNPHVRMTFST